MRGAVFTIILFFYTLAASAGDTDAISFESLNNLVLVQVSTPNSPKSLTFLFDTGASVSVLDRSLCRHLGLKGGSRVVVEGVGGFTEGRWPVKLDARLADRKLPAKFLSLDLSELSEAVGRPLDGIVGADFIREQIIRLDYANQKLTILDSKSFQANPLAAKVKLKRRNGIFLVPVMINNARSEWFRLDTGCSSSLHWVNAKAARTSRAPEHTIAGVRDAQSSSIEVSVRLGSGFSTVDAVLHDKPVFAGEAGLLGNGYLSIFVVTLDAKTAHLYLENHSYHAAATSRP